MKRVQRANGSLAQSGARSPSVLPAGNMAKPICLRKSALCRTDQPPYPNSELRIPHSELPPRSSVTPSESPAKNAQAQSEPNTPDNRTTFENALKAISTHAGIGTQHIASRSVWRCAANSRRDLTQNATKELQTFRRSICTRPRLCRNYNRPAPTPRRRTIHYHIIRTHASPRQRGQTPLSGIDCGTIGDLLGFNLWPGRSCCISMLPIRSIVQTRAALQRRGNNTRIQLYRRLDRL